MCRPHRHRYFSRAVLADTRVLDGGCARLGSRVDRVGKDPSNGEHRSSVVESPSRRCPELNMVACTGPAGAVTGGASVPSQLPTTTNDQDHHFAPSTTQASGATIGYYANDLVRQRPPAPTVRPGPWTRPTRRTSPRASPRGTTTTSPSSSSLRTTKIPEMSSCAPSKTTFSRPLTTSPATSATGHGQTSSPTHAPR